MIANPTTSTSDAVRRGARLPETWVRAAVVVLASFAIGMVTFFAQGFLPDALTSFANSASGWTLVTVLLLAWARVSTPLATALGAVSFVVLTVGYSASAHLKGLYYDPTLFVVVGIVVGPFVGVATSWLRAASEWRTAAGTALLTGIGLGEAVFGLTAVAATTSPVYWILIAVVALGLLVAMLVRGVRSPLARGATVVGAAAVAAAFLAAYSALGQPLSRETSDLARRHEPTGDHEHAREIVPVRPPSRTADEPVPADSSFPVRRCAGA